MSKPLVQVCNLVKHFPVRVGLLSTAQVRAVDNVSFDIGKGETLGLVGESGCGKTTLGKCILRLLKPTSGEIYFDGENIANKNRNELQAMRKKMSIVFQNVYSSLDPRMLVKQIVSEPLIVHKAFKKSELDEKISELLEQVGLEREHALRYPHEFSGGQRQRIAIARALALNPTLIVLDEPTSALDVSVQAKVLNLLVDLQKNLNLTYIFISHNLDVIRYMSNRIAVMYVGRIMEVGSVEEIYSGSKHPYTQTLLESIPTPNPMIKRKKIALPGEVPSPFNPPSGCRFHPRCTSAIEKCRTSEPELLKVGKDHCVACFCTHEFD